MDLMNDRMASSSSLLLHSVDDSCSGDLFGALIHSQLHASSELYTSMDMCLTIPFLEEPRDIFDTGKRGRQNAAISATANIDYCSFSVPPREGCSSHEHLLPPQDCQTSFFQGPEGEEGEEVQTDSQLCQELGVRRVAVETSITLPTTKPLQRQYLTMASKDEFFGALHNRQYINGTKPGLLWPESACAALCLRAITGMDSSIFDIKAGAPAAVFIAGYSVRSVEHHLSYFYDIYAIRKILERAKTSLCEPSSGSNLPKDPASLALGAALEDMLHICDAAVTELETHLAATTRSEGNSGCSLATIVNATLSPFAVLKNLLCMIMPTDISSYPEAQHVCEDASPSSGSLSPREIDFYLNVYQWQPSPLKEAEERVGYPAGWSLLSHLAGHLTAARGFYSSSLLEGGGNLLSSRGQHQPVTLPGGLALLTTIGSAPSRDAADAAAAAAQQCAGSGSVSSSCVASAKTPRDYIRVCVASFLVRRVSLPLLERLDRTLFHLHSDHPALCSADSTAGSSGAERVALMADVSRLPPCAQDVSSPPLDSIQHALQWASTRLAQAQLQGPFFGALLKQYAAVGEEACSKHVGGAEETADSRAEEMCPDLGLVFPLHPLDTASNAKKSEKSVQKISEMANEVRNFMPRRYLI
jgi:hypothetical protein